MILDLPLPPSTNRLWKFRGGRRPYKSPEYEAWLIEAGYAVNRQRGTATPIASACEVECYVGKMHALRDLDSAIKPLGDLLQAAGVVVNDNLISKWTVEKSDVPKPGRVEVFVKRRAST